MTLDSGALPLGHLFYYWKRAKVWLEDWLQDSNCIADVGGYSIVVSSDLNGLDIEVDVGTGYGLAPESWKPRTHPLRRYKAVLPKAIKILPHRTGILTESQVSTWKLYVSKTR